MANADMNNELLMVIYKPKLHDIKVLPNHALALEYLTL